MRERPEDIIALTARFLDDLGRQFGRAPAGITHDAKAVLLAHHWRGNARELRNALERAAILAEGGPITPEHLALEQLARPDASPTTDVRDMERQLIVRVLRDARGNKSRAARKLGLSRKQLSHRIGLYGIG